MSIRREFSALLARMHRVDYSKETDTSSGSASNYMMDITDKLALVKEEILGSYRVGQLGKDWYASLSLPQPILQADERGGVQGIGFSSIHSSNFLVTRFDRTTFRRKWETEIDSRYDEFGILHQSILEWIRYLSTRYGGSIQSFER